MNHPVYSYIYNTEHANIEENKYELRPCLEKINQKITNHVMIIRGAFIPSIHNNTFKTFKISLHNFILAQNQINNITVLPPFLVYTHKVVDM